MDRAGQGELFAEFATKPVERPREKPASSPKAKDKIHEDAPKMDLRRFPKQKKHYSYDEYLKIYCGNSAAADYWWRRDMKGLEEERKCGLSE